jgi:hypothetical protein
VLLVLRCSYNKHWHSDGQVVTPAIELCYWLLIPVGALHILSEGVSFGLCEGPLSGKLMQGSKFCLVLRADARRYLPIMSFSAEKKGVA